MAYIISNNQIIAHINTELKNGQSVRFSDQSCDNQKALVNAMNGKISTAKKWDKEWEINGPRFVNPRQIDENEFLVDAREV